MSSEYGSLAASTPSTNGPAGTSTDVPASSGRPTGSVTVIDGKTNLPVSKVQVGTIPYAIGLDAPARLAYVTNYTSNDLTVVGR